MSIMMEKCLIAGTLVAACLTIYAIETRNFYCYFSQTQDLNVVEKLEGNISELELEVLSLQELLK